MPAAFRQDKIERGIRTVLSMDVQEKGKNSYCESERKAGEGLSQGKLMKTGTLKT
jgi:hypothetical protein